MAALKFNGGTVMAGPGYPTRVNALLGATSRTDIVAQRRKIEALVAGPEKPDVVSDLSTLRIDEAKLWRVIASDTKFVAGTLPIYRAKHSNNRVDPLEVADIAVEQMEDGVGLVTIHPTATYELIDLSVSRMIPYTSRGGGMAIRDMLARRKAENVYLKILPELVSAARSRKVTLSLGATFRSATIFDSCDVVQQAEIAMQLNLARDITSAGVDVCIETPGHARPSSIRRIASLFRDAGFPVMPLGPIPTDNSVGQDHVSAAIGATLLGLEGCAHILAAVTREEHTGGVPSVLSTIEAVECARVAAKIIDLELLGADAEDRRIATARASSRTCVDGRKARGCARCAELCPL